MSIGLFSRPAFFVHGLAVTGFHPVFFGQFVQIVPHVVPVSRIPSVRTDAQTKVVASVKMPFAYIAGGDPLIRKTLPNGLYIGPGSERVGKAPFNTAEKKSMLGRINNPKFVANAPKDLIEQTKSRVSEIEIQEKTIQELINSLNA